MSFLLLCAAALYVTIVSRYAAATGVCKICVGVVEDNECVTIDGASRGAALAWVAAFASAAVTLAQAYGTQ